MAGSEDSTRSTRGPSTGPWVLIVDDDERLGALLTEYLGQFGFSVRTATHAEHALRRIKADAALGAIPVVIISYKDREEDRMRCLYAGAKCYLTKSSFHDQTFLRTVVDLIGEALG